MSTSYLEISDESKQAARRFSYVIAIVINVAMLVIVQNILEWGWPPFLTDEFAEVVPWISFSLIASIVVNVIYQFDDSHTVKSMGQIGVNLISVWVTYTVLTVFPFDFSGLRLQLGSRGESRTGHCDSRSRYRRPRRGDQAGLVLVGPEPGRLAAAMATPSEGCKRLGKAGRGAERLRRRATTQLGRLTVHPQHGSDVVFEAYNMDVEAGD